MLIAITGGIGAGKSMVSNILTVLGAYTINADDINAELMTKSSYIEKIRDLFPEAVIHNHIDKKILSNIVFNDKKSLIKLNAIAHPLITGIIIYEASLVKDKHVFVEIPLLIESGIGKIFDKIWYVESDVDKRIDRANKRDNINIDTLRKVIAAQSNEIKAKDLATDIIFNNDSEEKLWEEVQKLYLSL